MSGYRTGTSQRAPAIQTRQIMSYRSVGEKPRVTSFFIYRATCLWDAVGHFLRSSIEEQDACAAGLCCNVSPKWHPASRYHFK